MAVLQPTNSKAKECYERAARARERAKEAHNDIERHDFLADEERWLKLAKSYEFTERVSNYLKKASTPSHPKCATCAVPMWLVNVQRDRWYYECKVCEAKLDLPPVAEE